MMRDFFYENSIAKTKDNLSLERISTGIPKLDTLLQGGYPKGSIVLISGPPGSGKTILCLHFIDEGIKNGEKCLYVAVDQKTDSLLLYASSVGFNFLPAIEEGSFKVVEIDVERSSAYDEVSSEIMSGNYERIVIDSLSPFIDTPLVLGMSVDFEKAPVIDKLSTYSSESRSVTRFHIRRIFDILQKSSSTSLVTSELNEKNGLSRDGISEFLADGVIVLSLDPMMDRRKLTIWKMRGTRHSLRPVDMVITERGIEIK